MTTTADPRKPAKRLLVVRRELRRMAAEMRDLGCPDKIVLPLDEAQTELMWVVDDMEDK